MPPGKVFKAVWKTGRVVRKGFKFAKYGRKHLHAIANGLEAGLKADLDGSIIKFTKNGDEIARISDNILTFNYSGFGGEIVTNPNKTTTVIGRYTGGTDGIINSGLFKYGENKGGLNLLNDPAWTLPKNLDWLNQAIERGDVIRVISDPRIQSNIGSPGAWTTFGEEVNLLKNAGFVFDELTFTFKR